MTDPREPGAQGVENPPPEQPASALELGTLRAPKGVEFKDPHSQTVYAWLVDLTKATRGVRVYADNNEMFHKFVDKAHGGLTAILEVVPELNLSVREDRLLFNGDPVLINPDREEGIPWILYRNAFRRITLRRGMAREELVSFMRAITTEYGGAGDYAGEDLVTALWRMSLPHLGYLAIDAISATTGGQVSDDVKRIQGSIEDIVAAIYRNNAAADDDDVVAGVSITKEDLEALKEIRQESIEDLEILDRVTERAIADIPATQLTHYRKSLDEESREELVRRVMGIFLRILFKEQSSRESTGTIDIIQRLFESMILGARFNEARELVERLGESATQAEDLREMHIAQHLLQMFASDNRVMPVLEAFNEEYGGTSVHDKIRYLRSLGSAVAPILLRNLETLTTPGHRRLVCDLIVDFGVPEPIELMHEMDSAKWFVVRDIMRLAQQHPPGRISALIGSALRHEHPKVRQHAVGMLRGYARGLADKMLAERLQDPEIDVRLAAARVAAARRSAPCSHEIERLLSNESIFEREPRELRTLMVSYAAISGEAAVPLLDKLLSPGFFARLKSLDAQIAAALALGSIRGPAATEALQKGARTLSTKVREACKRALAKDFEKGESREDILAGRGLRIPDAATTNPNAPLPTADGADPSPGSGTPIEPTPGRGTPLEGTPPKGNSMDIDFTIGTTADVNDLLDGAPVFTLDLGSAESTTVPVQIVDRARPSLPRVDALNPVRESMPENLPPAPSQDVGPAPDLVVSELRTADVVSSSAHAPPPVDPVHGRDVMPDMLPHVPPLEVRPPPLEVEPMPPPPAEPPPPEQAPPPSPTSAYEDIEQELMAYLGVGDPDATPPPPVPAAIEVRGPLEPVEPEPEVAPEPPRFGGAAADSGVWSGSAPSRDSEPNWGMPSGPQYPPQVPAAAVEPPPPAPPAPAEPPATAELSPSRDFDLPMEAPAEIEEVPMAAFETHPPSAPPLEFPDVEPNAVPPAPPAVRAPSVPPAEAATEVAKAPPRRGLPEATTEVEKQPKADKAAVPVDDLFLDDGGET